MILSCKNLYASYGTKKILNAASICVSQGEFICLCGPNGSGKSTLLKILCGLEKNSGGSLSVSSVEQMPRIDGNGSSFQLHKLSRKKTARLVSFLEQKEFSAWNTTVFDMILTGRFAFSSASYTKKDYEIVRESSAYLGIENLLERNIYSLSGGEFQKCRLARAVAQTAPFLVLDEPSANLDILYENELLQKLRNIAFERNIGVLISIHNINAASRFAQKIALLTKDGIISGTSTEVFTQQNIDNAYGKGLNIYSHPIWNCPQIG